MRCSGEIMILNKEGIIEKISYERRAHESVDEKSLSWIISRKTMKKRIHAFIVQELAIKKRHQAYRIAAIVHIARLKPKSWFFESQSLTRGGLA